MSKKQAAAAEEQPAATVEVRALMDDDILGMKAGALATIPAEALAAMKQTGRVDDHPDAVAYARSLQ